MNPLARTMRSLAVALVAALAGLASADAEPGRAGIVTALHGTATVTRASLAGPRALSFRDPVFLKDRIATGDESLARILLGGKALVTVRERSVVTITESPRISTVDLASGTIALSVAKERMRPGESIEIRTPNAVAGIRGTVVIAEVARTGADVSTRFTLLTGVIEVLRLDTARQPIGAAAVLHPLQSISVTGALSPVRPITRDEGKAASAGFQLPVRTPARSGADWVARDQVEQAVAIIDPDRGRAPDVKPDKGGKADRDDKPERIDKVAPPITTPLVPPTALQPSKDPKGPKDKKR